MSQGSVPWPPPGDASTEQVADGAHARLAEGSGGASVNEVTVDGVDPWHLTVTLGEPAPDAVGGIRRLLAPLDVDVVWYTGSVESVPMEESVEDVDAGPGSSPVDGICGVCGTVGRCWRHAVPAAAERAAVAVAANWLLCRTCHELACAGNTDALARRMRDETLAADEVRAIARLLVDGAR